MTTMDDQRGDAALAPFPALPADLSLWPRLRVMDVDYVHLRLGGGDDLYLTAHGVPLAEMLLPHRYWTDEDWSRANRRRLDGTSAIYRIRTKPFAGRQRDIVLKWNRMGQDIPCATRVRGSAGAEFNSPFEEFALTMELRSAARRGGHPLLTHKPLAIYVPGRKIDPEQLGRKLYLLEAKQDDHWELELDFERNYAVIYEWIKGLDAAEAMRNGLIAREALPGLVARADRDLRDNGFVMRDNKPENLIVRPAAAGGLEAARDGQPLYAAIDFELLQRTGQREREVRAQRRQRYLVKQARRFQAAAAFPPHLHPVNVMGVDYVHGRIESTGGALWVVGRDPDLFDYFLPEKWRKTARTRLSVTNQVYDTFTKDSIHLVWRVSRVGERPDMDPFKADEKHILDHGYNSPFEEVSLAMRLTAAGIGSIYPRAVYMTGEKAALAEALADDRRYATHASLRTPDSQPLLRKDRDYIILWGYWNGPDELLATKDDPPFTSINALQAYRQGLLDEPMYLDLMRRARDGLARAGVEDLNLRGGHLLLSRLADGRLATGSDGLPTMLICNFELLRKM